MRIALVLQQSMKALFQRAGSPTMLRKEVHSHEI